MNVGNNIKTNQETLKQIFLIGILLMTACCLGLFVPSLSSESASQTLAIGVLAVAVIGVLSSLVLELPIIVFARYIFVFSFFFKGEINILKIDEIEDPSGFNLSLTLVMSVILIAHDFFYDDNRRAAKVFPSGFLLISILLFLCGGLSVVYSGSSLLGWFSLWSFSASLLVAYVLASHFSRRERLTQLLIGLAGGIALTGLVSLSQYFFSFPDLPFFGTGTEEELLGTQSQLLSRVPGFLRTPTEMAWVISSLLPLLIAPLISRIKDFADWQKVFLLGSASLGVMAVILSLARGSWISLLAALAVVFAFGWYRLSQKERKTYFVSVAGVFLLGCLALAPFGSRIYERLTEDDQGSALIRVPLMETAWRMIQDNPLVGVGLNGYRGQMTKYDETDIFVSQVFPNPVHNVFAHITAEIGLPGGILFGLLILVALYECLRSMNMQDKFLFILALATFAGLIAFVISALKEPGSLGSTRPPLKACFFLMGISLAISRIRRQIF